MLPNHITLPRRRRGVLRNHSMPCIQAMALPQVADHFLHVRCSTHGVHVARREIRFEIASLTSELFAATEPAKPRGCRDAPTLHAALTQHTVEVHGK